MDIRDKVIEFLGMNWKRTELNQSKTRNFAADQDASVFSGHPVPYHPSSHAIQSVYLILLYPPRVSVLDSAVETVLVDADATHSTPQDHEDFVVVAKRGRKHV